MTLFTMLLCLVAGGLGTWGALLMYKSGQQVVADERCKETWLQAKLQGTVQEAKLIEKLLKEAEK